MRNLIFGTLALVGCSEADLKQLDDPNADNGARIEVTPLALDFGTLGDNDDPSIRTFTVTSVGSNDVTVETIEIEGQDALSFTLMSAFSETVLPAQESIDIQVVFSPQGQYAQLAEAVVSSNAYEDPVIPVALIGEAAVPDLVITPDPLSFGNTYIGCTNENQVKLTNVGSEKLTIYNVTHTGAPFLMESLPVFPIDLMPEEELPVPMTFSPEDIGLVEGTMEVVSNDPDGNVQATQLGTGNYQATYELEWENPATPPSDIVFLIDQSCSMGDDSSLLASSFNTFITELDNYTTDWQVMVIGDPGHSGTHDGCSSSGVLTSTSPNYIGTFESAAAANRLDSGYNYSESLLGLSELTIQNSASGCNQGFMRQNAMLHIIVISDEAEQGFPNGSNVSTIVDNIAVLKGNPNNVRISGIYNPNSNESGNCPGTCAGRYADAIDITGGEHFNISNNWATPANLALLAEASVISDAYPLEYPAIDSTIEVYVNGYLVDPGLAPNTIWTYDETLNSVVFENSPPGEGDTIRIVYSQISFCEENNCSDGEDEDHDSLIDCADPDCTGDPDCP